MSTPLFIREPVSAPVAAVPGDGTTPGNFPLGPTTDAVEEATLVEEIRYCAQGFSTNAGEIVVWAMLPDPGTGGGLLPVRVMAADVAAGTATSRASGSIECNFALAPGSSLFVKHDVQDGGGDALFDFAAFGGIVR